MDRQNETFQESNSLRLHSKFEDLKVSNGHSSSILNGGPLSQVWVLVYGHPRGAKKEHILKAVSEPVGKFVTVDLGSLEGDDPARIEVLCSAPADLDGLALTFYFRRKGRRLTYELDMSALEDLGGAGPPPPSGGLLWVGGGGGQPL